MQSVRPCRESPLTTRPHRLTRVRVGRCLKVREGQKLALRCALCRTREHRLARGQPLTVLTVLSVRAEDGYVDAQELRNQLGASVDVEALIKQADKNGDGKIDYNEFCDILRDS